MEIAVLAGPWGIIADAITKKPHMRGEIIRDFKEED